MAIIRPIVRRTVTDTVQPTVGIFDPRSISGLQLWLDAAAPNTIRDDDVDDFVSRWNDKSGKGNDAIQGTGSAQPQTNMNTLNGLNVITTNGGDTMPLPSALNGITSGNSTIFILCRRASEDASNDTVFGFTQGGAIRWGIQYDATSGNILYVHNTSSNVITSTGNTNTDFQVLMGRRSGTTQAFAVDGGTEDSDTNAVDITGITDRFIMSQNGVSAALTGDTAEILLYDSSLSADNITNILGYFTAKWGVP